MSSLRNHKRLSRACSGEARTDSHVCNARVVQQQNVLLQSWRDSPHTLTPPTAASQALSSLWSYFASQQFSARRSEFPFADI